MESKSSKFNTLLLILLGGLGTVAWWGVSGSISRLELNMMPRAEIQIQLESIKASAIRTDADLLEFRARLGKLEIEIARLTKP